MNKSKNKKRGVKREKGRQRRVFFFRAKSGEEGEAGWGDEKREGGVFFFRAEFFFRPNLSLALLFVVSFEEKGKRISEFPRLSPSALSPQISLALAAMRRSRSLLACLALLVLLVLCSSEFLRRRK